MFTSTHSRRRRTPERAARRPRRGAALVFVMVFVFAMAALAMSSIFMASNANLLAKSYDRERDLRYAAEAALAIGKSRVNADPNILVMRSAGQLDTLILGQQTLVGADGNPMSGIKVNVYVGPTGSTSGQHGRFSSIVAEARDQRGNGFIRRLELTQESFAKFAYWSNQENATGASTIYFGGADELWGPVWSNDTITIHPSTATFHDEVGTAWIVNGASYGTFTKGKKERQKPISLPSTSILSNLNAIATSSGWSFVSNGGTASNAETSVRDRIEFVAFDLTPTITNGDSTDLNEGFFRVYNGKVGADTAVRGDWPGVASSPPAITNVNFCGDFHWMNATQQGFYPASQHNKSWFKAQVKAGYQARGYSTATSTTFANADSVSTLHQILTTAPAHGEDPPRCYLAGDPHLVWIDRGAGAVNPLTAAAYTAAEREKGGTDTTFTPNGAFGSWRLYSATPNDSVRKYRPKDASYLFPIDRSFNSNAKGVIYTSGNVGISGVVNGRITLYAKGTIVLVDDIRYANDPVKGVCRDILGIISDKDVVIADNALNDPPVVSTVSSSPFYFSLDDSKDFYIHGVMMALGNSFRVENFSSGPNNVNDCNGTNNGRGCIYLSGGVIQNIRGAVGLVSGEGYQKRYSYDRCAVVNPPPYFPTTGRFQDNRYLELDPAGFNHTRYFRSLTPDP
jgi:hypothetical protein